MRLTSSLIIDHRSLSAADLPIHLGDSWVMLAPGASSTCTFGSSCSCTSTAAIAHKQ